MSDFPQAIVTSSIEPRNGDKENYKIVLNFTSFKPLRGLSVEFQGVWN
jgi:hypothetical protein